MRLRTITFTGADDKVDKQQLYNISDVNHRVEWGILISSDKYGSQRYPSIKWTNSFLRYKPSFVKSAAHLCNTAVIKFIYDFNYREYLSDFDRVQLNVADYNQLDLNHFMDSIGHFADTYDKDVILQYNDKSKHILNEILPCVDVDILFDSSRGKGKLNIDIPESIAKYFYTGYAGGINSYNIVDVMNILNLMYYEDQGMWIDMETGIRTNNEFDVNKIMLVLKQLYERGY